MFLRKLEKKYFFSLYIFFSIFREALIGSFFSKVSSQKVVFHGGILMEEKAIAFMLAMDRILNKSASYNWLFDCKVVLALLKF